MPAAPDMPTAAASMIARADARALNRACIVSLPMVSKRRDDE
jgi:hypothetical protein